jgi:hypothetical protein
VAGNLALRVAIVYDDALAGQRALNLLENLEGEAQGTIRLNPVLWRFDRLERLIWRCHASDDVLASEIVVVSLSKHDGVPGSIQSWLSNCLQRKDGGYNSVLTLMGDGSVHGTVVLRRSPQPRTSLVDDRGGMMDMPMLRQV